MIIKKQPPEVFYKKDVLKNFTKIHRKTPVPESLLQPETCNFTKKKSLALVFHVNFVKCLRILFLPNTSRQLFLTMVFIKLSVSTDSFCKKRRLRCLTGFEMRLWPLSSWSLAVCNPFTHLNKTFYHKVEDSHLHYPFAIKFSKLLL